MTLEVEDGTAKSNAESYASVAYADAHHAARGNTLWATLLEAEKEQALRRATDYMEQIYSPQLSGYRKTTTQALSWPRYEVPRLDVGAAAYGEATVYWANDAVPDAVQKSCAELAFRAAEGELEVDGEAFPKKAVKLGPIEVEYFDRSAGFRTFRAVDSWLRVFFGESGRASAYTARVTR